MVDYSTTSFRLSPRSAGFALPGARSSLSRTGCAAALRKRDGVRPDNRPGDRGRVASRCVGRTDLGPAIRRPVQARALRSGFRFFQRAENSSGDHRHRSLPRMAGSSFLGATEQHGNRCRFFNANHLKTGHESQTDPERTSDRTNRRAFSRRRSPFLRRG